MSQIIPSQMTPLNLSNIGENSKENSKEAQKSQIYSSPASSSSTPSSEASSPRTRTQTVVDALASCSINTLVPRTVDEILEFHSALKTDLFDRESDPIETDDWRQSRDYLAQEGERFCREIELHSHYCSVAFIEDCHISTEELDYWTRNMSIEELKLEIDRAAALSNEERVAEVKKMKAAFQAEH